MKKNFNRGFVLAETLIVTVFLLAIFSMIYSNYYPLIGEFEKREVYDDVESKYGIFWIKRIVEDPAYNIIIPDPTNPRFQAKTDKIRNFHTYGYFRFECSDIIEKQKRGTCISLVNALEISNCDRTTGDGCDIFITRYKIGPSEGFKKTVETNLAYKDEECFDPNNCKTLYINKCIENISQKNKELEEDQKRIICEDKAKKNVFNGGFQDYVFTLPDYQRPGSGVNYRVFAIFNHPREGLSYTTYATTEINKEE